MTRNSALVTAVIAALGAVGGAVAAFAMNLASAFFAGDPYTPGYVLYHFSVPAVAILGAVVAPLVGWTMLRTTPIWRAVAEPSAAALCAGAIAMLLAPSAYMIAIPLAAAAASWRLHHHYSKTSALIAAQPTKYLVD